MVAFHFQFSNQAGWKCDICRKSGLERKRRCGWLGLGEEPGASPVWARKHVAVSRCPKSYITAESLSMMEDFFLRRRLGATDLTRITARQADAFMVLEDAIAAEIRDGQQNSTKPL